MINQVEAVLFLTPRPLTLKEIAKLVGAREEEVKEAIEELKQRYEGTSLTVEEFLGSYRLNVREEYRDVARKLGLIPEFTKSQLKIIGLLLRNGEMRLSEMKRRYSKADEFVKLLKSYGFVVTEKRGRSVVVKKTRLLERYFGVTEGGE